jgi:hypothetical protein
MAHTEGELKDELRKAAFILRTLMADARRQLHLGGPKAEAEWERLEPLVRAALVRAEQETSEESCWSAAKAAMAMRAFCGSLRKMALEGTDRIDLDEQPKAAHRT